MLSKSPGSIGIYIAIAAVVMLFAPAQAAECALADRIRAANTNRAVGACPAGTSHDIITIMEDITLTERLPPITGTITIEGDGHTISGAWKFRIFDVRGGRLTINDLTLTGGREASLVGGDGKGEGGAILARDGAEVIVNDSMLSRNQSHFTGGAISAIHSKLTLRNSSFVDNRVGHNGGAIALQFSKSAISQSSFVGNRAKTYSGGAIYVGHGATLDVLNSSFSDNRAPRGGAVATNVTTTGGVYHSQTTLTHVTIARGRGVDGGLGFNIWVDKNDLNFSLRNSLIIGQKRPYRKESSSCHGPLNQSVANIIEDGSCAPIKVGDPLVADMTGAPAYFPLQDGSPALDAADARFCAETDQLGAPRPHGAGCDIGAVEATDLQPAPTAIAGICALPDQIMAANTDSAIGNCPAGNGPDTIHLVRDYTLNAKLPPITSVITIEGNGHAISGDNLFGIFEVDGGTLTISNTTLTESNASIGGALVLKNGGFASVEDVVFSNNQAYFGAAIATTSENDRLWVSRSSFAGNRAETSGGAIMMDGGVIAVSSSALFDNRAEATGGAIAALRGQASVFNSTLSGNAASQGGGIYVNGAAVTLTHLTMMNNEARRIAGAGLYAEAGAVRLYNSIVAGSGRGDDCSGDITHGRGNFSQDGTCAEEAGGDPALAVLVGAPAHHPLLDSSPAHRAADPAFCPPADQLGNPRTHCDAGAIESERDPNYVARPKPSLPDDCTLADQIRAANTDEPAGACPAGDGADVIALRQDIRLDAPLPAISSDITITGAGHSISGEGRFRIFDIESGNVAIKQITLADGRNPGERPDGYGGAITLRNRAELLVLNATFRNNQARMGGAIASIDSSSLYVFESSFLDNVASGKGGAIWRDGLCGRIFDINFRRNTAGELAGTELDDLLTHIDGGASRCADDPETYTLSDS